MYVRSLELFPAWQARGVKDIQGLDRLLQNLPPARQVKLLKEQLEMRVIALGMSDFEVAYSCKDDPCIGGVAHLRGALQKALVEERVLMRRGELPEQPMPPQFKMKTVKVLGTATCDALELQKSAKLGVEKLRDAAEAERLRRIEAGINDDVQASARMITK